MPDYLTGGMPGKSIKDNAFPHLGQPAIVTLDIKNCFPSIHNGMVYKVWREVLGTSEPVSALLTKLTTLQHRLPQGSTASPILCNLVLAPLANQINEYALSQGLAYTQYVDDITISGDPNKVRAAIAHLIPLVASHGLQLGRGKIVIMDSNELQKTTGIKVNSGMTLPSKKIAEIRRDIRRLHSLGNAAKTYEINSLWGKINFYKTIDGKRGGALYDYAKLMLVNLTGTYAEKPSDITRTCRDYDNLH
jgi:retron-type reverse transcriptase